MHRSLQWILRGLGPWRPAAVAAGFLALAAPVWAQDATSTDLFLGGEDAAGQTSATAGGEAAGGRTPSRDDARTARGVLEPAEEAIVSSELAARIDALPFDDGMGFPAGAVLVSFDCALFQARRSQAVAQLQGARTKLDNARQLQRTNAIGELDVALARAEVQRTAAAVAEAEVAVQRCEIVAPYDGRVVETFVNAHEVASPGVELLAIVSRGALEATLLVPSSWLVWLEEGTGFRFTVDETGATLDGRVAVLGARVDPVSQTVPVRVVLDVDPEGDAGAALVPGMSGTARFPRDSGSEG